MGTSQVQNQLGVRVHSGCWSISTKLTMSLLVSGVTVLSGVKVLATSPDLSTAQTLAKPQPARLAQVRQPALFRQQLLKAGDTIIGRYRGTNRQIFQKGETRDLTLALDQPIYSASGQAVFPAGSLIKGQIVPEKGGGVFVASSISTNSVERALAAKSSTLHDVKDPRQISAGAIAQDAAIGAGGGIILGQVFGEVFGRRRITIPQVLGGAAAGVVVGNVTAPRAVVVQPNAAINLTLSADLSQ